ncbi:hypothetical protein IE4872_PC00495 (plasmid) [Rhizobium gallicum]|uniref:Uncharacterized protein n=1 Tax=Rhizobium gallicum TaxID=56730 RepID=A0A1L5NRN0_9HYPH|nr:hypothetical protein IE4872_PC00495 [Rhizobium gallicum]
MLASLKMNGVAQAVGELTEQASPAFEAAIPILSQPRRPNRRSGLLPKAARLAPSRPSISSTRSNRRRGGGAPANRPFLSIPILLILDELGNLPFSASGGGLLFHRRHLSSGKAQWFRRRRTEI